MARKVKVAVPAAVVAAAVASAPQAAQAVQATPPAAIAGTGNPAQVGVKPAAPAGIAGLDELDNATPTVKKSKSSVPTVRLSDPVQAKALAGAIEGLRKESEGKALQNLSKGILFPAAAASQVEISRKSKEYVKSVRFIATVADPADANKTVEVTAAITCPTQFCKVNVKDDAAQVAGLKATFGQLYDRYFSVEREITLEQKAFTDAFVNDLMELFKKHNYKQTMEVDGRVVPGEFSYDRILKAKGLDEAAVMDPAVGALLEAAIKGGFIKAYSPTLKEK